MADVWKKCSICKKDIPCRAKYFLCSVSTCRHPRTGLQFCSVECWDGHLGYVNHRESWAEESVAPAVSEISSPPQTNSAVTSHPASRLVPSSQAVSSSQANAALNSSLAARAPVRKIVEPRSSSEIASTGAGKIKASEIDTLVVVSKVKQLIRDRSEYNTSQCCIDALTEKVAEICLKAIGSATEAGRKTVMGRDVK